MKHYVMSLPLLCALLISWGIFSSEQYKLFNNAVEQFDNLVIAQRGRCVLVSLIANVEDLKKFALGLHGNNENSPLLLCPNEEYGRTDGHPVPHHWVSVLHYKDGKEEKARDTNYQVDTDRRLLEHSSLILYALHNKALTVVPADNEKTSLTKSREKHIQELSFMLQDREGGNKAPVIVLVHNDIIKDDKTEEMCKAFKHADVEAFLDCLQTKKDVLGTGDKRKFSFSSLKIIAIPFILIIGYFLYKKLN